MMRCRRCNRSAARPRCAACSVACTRSWSRPSALPSRLQEEGRWRSTSQQTLGPGSTRPAGATTRPPGTQPCSDQFCIGILYCFLTAAAPGPADSVSHRGRFGWGGHVDGVWNGGTVSPYNIYMARLHTFIYIQIPHTHTSIAYVLHGEGIKIPQSPDLSAEDLSAWYSDPSTNGGTRSDSVQ